MMTHRQGRKTLRISDQDALLKWCRSNGFFLTQRDENTVLAFNITRRKTGNAQRAQADFVLAVAEKGFTACDALGETVAQGAELRSVLKQISAHLAGSHSEAS